MIPAALLLSAPELDVKLEQVLARPAPARSRSLIRQDPVEFERIEGKLQPSAPWQERPVNGWTAQPSGWVWFRVRSPRAQVLHLNVSGASMAFVNDEPRVGDVYSYGTYFLPVQLREGLNDVLVTGFRGNVTLNWRRPVGELEIGRDDATLPDFDRQSKRPHGAVGGFVIRNNTNRPRRVTLYSEAQPDLRTVRLIPPLGVIKAPVRIGERREFTVALQEGDTVWSRRSFKLEEPAPGEAFRRTFISATDRSAQYYAVMPASRPNPRALTLSLHGASVEAIGQARAYGPKPFTDIVCPTNRRPFGFNWETIGRQDAMEVLAHAQTQRVYDPSKLFLTGHSMGGHGTWHLGAHYPATWAAIGPCAGWISFDTYGGGANYNLSDPIQAVLNRANLASDTLKFKENFAHYKGVYIHHGAADDVVPVTEARRMRDELKGIANVLYHEEPGAGHWFDNSPEPGADSVDWKPMFDLFAKTERNRATNEWQNRPFVFADPKINGDFVAGTVLEAIRPFEPMRVTYRTHEGALHVTAENVRSFSLADGSVSALVVNGQSLPARKNRAYTLLDGKWTLTTAHPPVSPGFNHVYSNSVSFVLSDTGDPEETAWAWRKLRYDLEQLWYRGNATPEVVRASTLKPTDLENTHRLIYGSAFADLMRQKGFALEFAPSGDQALFAHVQDGWTRIAAIRGNTAKGRAFAERFPLFSPGVGYPDGVLADTSMLTSGATGLRAVSIGQEVIRR